MKTIYFSFLVSSIALTAMTLWIQGQQSQENKQPMVIKKLPKTRVLKAEYSDAEEWLEKNFKNLNFMFCSDIQPSFGVSKIVFRGWVFREHKNEWESIFVFDTRGLGDSVMNVNSDTGVFSIAGKANTKFSGKQVVMFDLNASIP